MKLKPRVILSLILTVIFGRVCEAQFYYSDLLSNQANNSHYQLLKKNKVSSIRGESYEATGEPTADFIFMQTVNSSYSQVKTQTSAPLSGKSAMTNYYNSAGLLYRTTDSSDASFTQYDYRYDSLNRLVQITSNSNVIGERTRVTETHDWSYDASGAPEKMFRIKDKSDTTVYLFKKDEEGKIIEEQSYHRNVAGEKTYYYYNDQQQLSDIVRFNDRVGKLLPDYFFNYNEQKQLAEMTTVQNGGSDYLIWKYLYNPDGLKKEEQCFNKLKKLVGRLVYVYEYRR
ncbi:hypothetical protein [Pollutibacter soli]|uniref:hypothetical protein n=1 Tax=Pollutibacter soli TaxID=3034157 RepID=UPI0030132F52